MTTRTINGQEWSGTPEQLDNTELGELIKGQKVTFDSGRGLRTGVVSGHSQSGGGNYPWILWLHITYRGGCYTVPATQITY